MKKSAAVQQAKLNEMLSRARLEVTLLAATLLAVFLSTTVPVFAQGFSGGVVVQGEMFDPSDFAIQFQQPPH